jgi:hypothetical protein
MRQESTELDAHYKNVENTVIDGIKSCIAKFVVSRKRRKNNRIMRKIMMLKIYEYKTPMRHK